jgi:hypothetical protein
MRNFVSTDKRLAEIEGRRGMGVIKLTFPDGSTRGVKIRHDYALELFEHVCMWARAFPPPAPAPAEGMVVDVEPPRPEPKTPSDRLIHLLGESVAIESREEIVFLTTIAGMARQMVARKKEREEASGNALTPHGGN